MPRHSHHKRKNRREARSAKEHGGVSAPSLPELDEHEPQPLAGPPSARCVPIPPELERFVIGIDSLATHSDAMDRALAAVDDDEGGEADEELGVAPSGRA